VNNNQLRALGVGLGIILLVVGRMHLGITSKAGNPNWYLLFMICGMALLLVYTFGEKRRRR